MIKPYYAHSTADADQRCWEALEWHLRRTGALARRFCTDYNMRAWGAVAGLLHDLGKYSEEFQRYLKGVGTSVDHSTAGAKDATERYGDLGHLLAYCIAGHHAGLPDGEGSDDGVLRKRLGKKLSLVDPCWRDRITLPERQALAEECTALLRDASSPFSVTFFARMLFSALVDADFLATEYFLDRKKSLARRASTPSLSVLATALHEHMERTFGGAPATPIAHQRASILAACRQAAIHRPGVFSLSVPTGGGKTLASFSFALEHAVAHGLNRVIYAIPFTSIIEQTADVFREVLAGAGGEPVLEHHSAAEPADADESTLIGPQRQRLATENWDMPVVVTTTVQLFDSLFAARPGRCRKLHNLARSVIVLDEAQALPVNRMQACVAALNELTTRYGATIVLCSATLPDLQAHPRLRTALPAGRAIVEQTPALRDAFRRVRTERWPERIGDEALSDRLAEAEQVLCIVDTRAHAADLFGRLPPNGRFHLSAAMCPAHRQDVLGRVKAALAAGAPCRLVATRVIEAGVDISFPEVWRAMAGIDSLAQAAGRCNRNGERKDGRFVVFEPAREDALPRGLPDLIWRAQTGRLVLERHGDPLEPAAIDDFFFELLDQRELDQDGCWRRLHQTKLRDIPFRSVADDFRMIDDEQRPLWIPWDDDAKRLIEQARFALNSPQPVPHRDLLRKLQRYAVGVPSLERLKDLVLSIDPEERFHALPNTGSPYDCDVGLQPVSNGLRAPESNIF